MGGIFLTLVKMGFFFNIRGVGVFNFWFRFTFWFKKLHFKKLFSVNSTLGCGGGRAKLNFNENFQFYLTIWYKVERKKQWKFACYTCWSKLNFKVVKMGRGIVIKWGDSGNYKFWIIWGGHNKVIWGLKFFKNCNLTPPPYN